METWVIILIIVLILLVISGISIGLYFTFRKPQKIPGNGSGGPNGSGTKTPVSPPKTPVSPPPPGTPPPKTPHLYPLIGGKFSISPASNSSLYMTYLSGNGITVLSSNSECMGYNWENVSSLGISEIVSGLVSTYNKPYSITAPISTKSSFPTNLSVPGSQTIQIQNWTYNSVNKTWCDLSGTYCLYLNTDKTITANTYNSEDSYFQWNNIPAITPDTSSCVPP